MEDAEISSVITDGRRHKPLEPPQRRGAPTAQVVLFSSTRSRTVAGRFLASSQLRDSKRSSSGSTFHWSWNKPQVEVSRPLAEPIGPLVSHSEGTHIVGEGLSGDIYFWERQSSSVASVRKAEK